jgi:hypothetical protein
MIKCSICTIDLTKQEAGDTDSIAPYQGAGHPFLCNRCIDNAIKGVSEREIICECEGDGCSLCTVFCGDCLTPAGKCGCLDE